MEADLRSKDSYRPRTATSTPWTVRSARKSGSSKQLGLYSIQPWGWRSLFVSGDGYLYAVWAGLPAVGERRGLSLLTPPYHPLPPGEKQRPGPVGQVKLVEDIADVAFDRFIADNQPLGNLGVAQAVGDET